MSYSLSADNIKFFKAESQKLTVKTVRIYVVYTVASVLCFNMQKA